MVYPSSLVLRESKCEFCDEETFNPNSKIIYKNFGELNFGVIHCEDCEEEANLCYSDWAKNKKLTSFEEAQKSPILTTLIEEFGKGIVVERSDGSIETFHTRSWTGVFNICFKMFSNKWYVAVLKSEGSNNIVKYCPLNDYCEGGKFSLLIPLKLSRLVDIAIVYLDMMIEKYGNDNITPLNFKDLLWCPDMSHTIKDQLEALEYWKTL
jgi:hypothetical protein